MLQDEVVTTTISSPFSSPLTTPTVYSQPLDRLCVPSTYQVPANITGTISYTVTQTCSTRWTYTGGAKPMGLRFNFATRHRLQPFLDSHLGFLAATRDFPVNNSYNFNFTFEFGAGIEFFRDHQRSVALEYRLHHLSNDDIGINNPGVDSQIVKVTYSFGR